MPRRTTDTCLIAAVNHKTDGFSLFLESWVFIIFPSLVKLRKIFYLPEGIVIVDVDDVELSFIAFWHLSLFLSLSRCVVRLPFILCLSRKGKHKEEQCIPSNFALDCL